MSVSRPRRNYADRRRTEREIAEIAERHNISDIAARTRKIMRQGREFMALCAFHSERSASMRLAVAGSVAHELAVHTAAAAGLNLDLIARRCRR